METVAVKANIRDQVRSKGANVTRAEGKIPSTGNWDTYETHPFGEIELSKGEQQIALLPLGELNGALVDLKSIRLVPRRN